MSTHNTYIVKPILSMKWVHLILPEKSNLSSKVAFHCEVYSPRISLLNTQKDFFQQENEIQNLLNHNEVFMIPVQKSGHGIFFQTPYI